MQAFFTKLAGWASLAIGIVFLFVPFIPGTPFLCLSAYCLSD